MTEYLYTDVANRIQSQIENQELAVGQKLPSERKMSEHYGVSRNVIREALKILTEKGMLDIRPGKGGYVTQGKNKDVSDKIEYTIYKNRTSLLEILEAREAIEMSVVRLAVEKATEENIRNFHEIYESMEKNRESQVNFLTDDMRFHLELAKCTQNSTLASLVETFYSIIDKKLFLVSQLYPQRSVQAQNEHWNMITAIENRDTDRLIASMKAHMECIRTQLQDGSHENV